MKCWGSNGSGESGVSGGGSVSQAALAANWAQLDGARPRPLGLGSGVSCGIGTAGNLECWGPTLPTSSVAAMAAACSPHSPPLRCARTTSPTARTPPTSFRRDLGGVRRGARLRGRQHCREVLGRQLLRGTRQRGLHAHELRRQRSGAPARRRAGHRPGSTTAAPSSPIARSAAGGATSTASSASPTPRPKRSRRSRRTGNPLE